MGSAFAKLFRRHKFRILVADIATELKPAAACARADVTIFSVPIKITPQVITECAPHAKSGSLLVDLTSLKTPAMAAFKKNAPANVEVVSLHPLFAPGAVAQLKKQVIAVCTLRAGSKWRWLSVFFKKQGAILTSTTANEHDRMMAIVQGITHFSAIASGMALKRLGANLKKTLSFASPIYRLRLAMIGRILNQSPALYAQIEIENPNMKKTAKAYLNSIQDLMNCVESGDEVAFENYFRDAAGFFGTFKNQAQRETDAIVKALR